MAPYFLYAEKDQIWLRTTFPFIRKKCMNNPLAKELKVKALCYCTIEKRNAADSSVEQHSHFETIEKPLDCK